MAAGSVSWAKRQSKAFGDAFAEDAGGMLKFSATTLVAQIATMTCSLLTMRWVPPELLGVWQTMLLVETYAMLLRLGVINGMNRQLPLLVGQGDTAAALDHVAATLAYTLIIGAVVLLGLMGAAVWLSARPGVWALSLGTLAFYTTCGLYSAFNEATFRGGQEFARLGRILLVNTGLAIATLPLVRWLGYSGHCGRLTVLALAYAILTHFARPLRPPPRLKSAALRSLLRVGLPLFVQNYVGRLARSTAPLVVLWLGGTPALGLFAPVTAVLSLVSLLPNSIMSYAMPRQTFDFGRRGSAAEIVARARRRALYLMGALSLPALSLLPLLPWVTGALLPKYAAAAPAMQVAVVIGIVRIFSVATSVYATLAAWRPMFVNLAFLWTAEAAGAILGGLYYASQPWFGATVGLFIGNLVYVPVTLVSLSRLARTSQRKEA